ncbi:MAG: Chlorinase [Methanonatronarchaeales archaeon]|nr:Chlorinase [Methanonatronarchaeales archaeon]
MPQVTLLTDFGEGPYTAAMRGVIASMTGARAVDLSHSVPRHDVRHGAFVLWSSVPYFPEGTVHCCVVDPGVGTGRRAIAARAGGQLLVGPDNGLILPAARRVSEGPEIREVTLDLGESSSTFHGRDVFAPVAAMLSADLGFEEVGPVSEAEDLELFVYRETGRGIKTSVAFVDRFGNVVTGVPTEAVEGEAFLVDTADASRRARRVDAYGEAGEGELLLLEGSTGLVELSVNQGSAEEVLGAEPGEEVILKKKG